MLIVDSAVQERRAAISPTEKHADMVQKLLAEEERNCVFVNADESLNPANEAAQLGKPLTPAELERRLKKFLPTNIISIYHPRDKTKKAFVKVLPGGAFETICAYENDVMPEHSIMKVKVEWIRDRNQTHLDRKDHTGAKIEKGAGVVFDSENRPGWKKVVRLWGESKRGWRTILLRLIQQKILTLWEAEQAFGSDNRPTWAYYAGKQPNATLPF